MNFACLKKNNRNIRFIKDPLKWYLSKPRGLMAKSFQVMFTWCLFSAIFNTHRIDASTAATELWNLRKKHANEDKRMKGKLVNHNWISCWVASELTLYKNRVAFHLFVLSQFLWLTWLRTAHPVPCRIFFQSLLFES